MVLVCIVHEHMQNCFQLFAGHMLVKCFQDYLNFKHFNGIHHNEKKISNQESVAKSLFVWQIDFEIDTIPSFLVKRWNKLRNRQILLYFASHHCCLALTCFSGKNPVKQVMN